MSGPLLWDVDTQVDFIMGLPDRQHSVAFVEDASRGLEPDFVAHSFELWHAGRVRFTTADEVVGT